MKKFLFTLATLLLAGSVCAEEYLYIEDFEATPGTQKTVFVKAHFDAMVSAWQCWVRLPEGVTIANFLKTDQANINYLGQVNIEDEETGEITTEYQTVTLVPGITEGAAPGEFVGITDALTYEYDYIDGVITNCGAVKWKPNPNGFGMFRLRLAFAEDFKGGVITVVTEPACGSDPRGNTCVMEPMQHHEKPCTVTVQKPAFVGTADVAFNGNVATLKYTSNDPDATVKVTVDGTETTVEWTKDEATGAYTATYTVVESDVPGEHSVTVALTVTPSENYTGEPASDSETYAYTVNDELKGDIELGDVTEDGKVTVTYTGDEEGVELAVVVKDKDGNVVENAYADGVITLPAYGEYTVTVTASADGYNDKTFDAETVTWEKKTVAAPVITPTTNETTVTVEITWPASDGTQVYTGEYSYDRTYEDQSFEVEAYITEGPTCKESAHAKVTIEVPAMTKPNATKPTITFTPDDNGVTVKIENYTEYTIKVNNVQVDPTRNEHTYYVEKGYEDKHIDVYAKNAPGDPYVPAEATGQYDLAKKVVLELPDPTIDVNNDDPNNTVITIEIPAGVEIPDGTVLSATVTDENDKVTTYTDEDGDGKIVITIPNGDETAYVDVAATTTLNGVPEPYDEVKPGEASLRVEIPHKPQLEQTDMPDIHVTTGKSEFDDEGNVTVDGHWKKVTFENMDADDPDPFIEYYIGDDPENGTWVEWDGKPLNFTQDGTYHVYVRATAEGKSTSEWNDVTVVVEPATGLNELTNGKAVAGVRYFNMAGQEMQEANGITIVVTTYTDGTTSAVKVIK